MARDNGQGMFTMDFINEIAVMKDLVAANAKVLEVINGSTAADTNKEKGRRLIDQSRTLNQLVLGMGNFTLSHLGMKKFR